MTKSVSIVLLSWLLLFVGVGCGDGKGSCPQQVLDRCFEERDLCVEYLPDAGDEMECEYDYCTCLEEAGCEKEARDHCDG